MKKSLLFSKALSTALALFVLGFASINSFAQTQVATLQHGEDFSAFYGLSALNAAYSEAVDGDIITLSSGVFNAVSLDKAIKIRGAGVTADDNTSITPTQINGDVHISSSNDSIALDIEGIVFTGGMIYHGLQYAKFTKCNINSIVGYPQTVHYGTMGHVQFIDCLIASARLLSVSDDVQIINCVVDHFVNERYEQYGAIYAYNSILMITCPNYSYHFGDQERMYMYNSIIENHSDHPFNESYAYNCIEIGTAFSNSVQCYDCIHVNNFSDVFETFDGQFAYNADYSLTEAIINSFHGNDGSQVGIFGGAMPYNPRPSYVVPHIIIVAGQSDANGNLEVNIEVVNEDK